MCIDLSCYLDEMTPPGSHPSSLMISPPFSAFLFSSPFFFLFFPSFLFPFFLFFLFPSHFPRQQRKFTDDFLTGGGRVVAPPTPPLTTPPAPCVYSISPSFTSYVIFFPFHLFYHFVNLSSYYSVFLPSFSLSVFLMLFFVFPSFIFSSIFPLSILCHFLFLSFLMLFSVSSFYSHVILCFYYFSFLPSITFSHVIVCFYNSITFSFCLSSSVILTTGFEFSDEPPDPIVDERVLKFSLTTWDDPTHAQIAEITSYDVAPWLWLYRYQYQLLFKMK